MTGPALVRPFTPEPRAPGGAFETCPAATGADDPEPCRVYPDTAHRCRRDRCPHIEHVCTCRRAWVVTPRD